MKRNLGKLDRLARMTIATLLAVLVLSNYLIGTGGIAGSIVAIYLFFTSLFGSSPLYALFKINTTKKKNKI